MRVASWNNKATLAQEHACACVPPTPPHLTPTHAHAHTDQYVTLIAFQQQQWFLELASLLRYTYIACIVLYMCHCYAVLSYVPLMQVTSRTNKQTKTA